MQIKYLDFKVLLLGIVNEESKVFLPHRFIGFVPNLKEIPENQPCGYLLSVFTHSCVWKVGMTFMKFQDIHLLSM